ncbi:MAG TPA: chloride channel protein [Deltaproteobacteria bacterium]|nr:chloride channel protein [Deltaproteobacteria bacterium]
MSKGIKFSPRYVFYSLDERLQLIIIGAIVGIFGGLASVALNRSLRYFSSISYPMRHLWYAPLLPAIGAALSVFFLRQVVRDLGAHSVPEVIYSISRKGGLLRLRTSFSRLVSGFLTIASGGSAGPEAPVVISGASIGSNIGTMFNLRDRQREVIVGCGAAAAIASIFNAPFAGIAFSLEVILGEWTTINLVPIAIASVVGTEVSRILQGNQIPFHHRIFHSGTPDLVACIGLAVLTAFGSIMLIRLLKVTESHSKKVTSVFWLRAALGGLIVGTIGLYLPQVLGEGYEVIWRVIGEQYSPGIAISGLAALGKIVATSLTIGSGGSGGLFAPCLVIGSLTGLFYQSTIASVFPSITWAGESYFALLGMAGVLSSVLQAPLTGIFLVVEITGGYEFIVPVVLVSVISATISHYFEPFSVYHQELITRGELLRPRTDARVLAELNVMELLEKDCMLVYPEMRLKEFVSIVQRSHRNYFPVVDSKSGDFLGMIHLDDVRPYLFNTGLHDTVIVGEIMNANVHTVSPDDELTEIITVFDREHSWSLPVVQDGKFLGLISKATLMDHYRKELIIQEEK